METPEITYGENSEEGNVTVTIKLPISAISTLADRVITRASKATILAFRDGEATYPEKLYALRLIISELIDVL